jgi:hypothetical protein
VAPTPTEEQLRRLREAQERLALSRAELDQAEVRLREDALTFLEAAITTAEKLSPSDGVSLLGDMIERLVNMQGVWTHHRWET